MMKKRLQLLQGSSKGWTLIIHVKFPLLNAMILLNSEYDRYWSPRRLSGRYWRSLPGSKSAEAEAHHSAKVKKGGAKPPFLHTSSLQST
jgi:hypothetical protein